MSDRALLMKGKLGRLARSSNSPILSYVTILVTCGGVIDKEYGYREAFSLYRAYWGESRYKDVGIQLEEEGIVKESEKSISLNIDGIESLEPSVREQLARELARVLFDEGRQLYVTTLKEIISTTEGDYILSELAKIGVDVLDETVHHISQAVGGKYFNETYEKLSSNGLLVHGRSWKSHSYYRFFPPLIDFIKVSDLIDKNALAFVYIAQHVRATGLVLAQDCTMLEQPIESLEIRGLVAKTSWYANRGFMTTEKGRHMASGVITERISKSKQELESALRGIPPRLLRFFSDSVLEGWTGRDVIKPTLGWDCYVPENELSTSPHLCLLNHELVREARDRLFSKLEGLGLCARAHNYVSTRGGEMREIEYVVAPEFKSFVQKFARENSYLQEPLFPAELELKHLIYHSLKGLSTYGGYYTEGYPEEI